MTKDRIREYLLSQRVEARVKEVRDDESLLEAGVLDSAGMVGLLAFLEEKYQIAIDEDDLTPENFDSVDAIAAYVNDRVGTVGVSQTG